VKESRKEVITISEDNGFLRGGDQGDNYFEVGYTTLRLRRH